MSDIGLDFTGLYVAAAIAAATALLAMPAVWALAAGLPWPRRAALAVLAAQGLAGPASLLAMVEMRDRELPFFALVLGLVLQALVLPVLIALRGGR